MLVEALPIVDEIAIDTCPDVSNMARFLPLVYHETSGYFFGRNDME